MVGTTEHGPIGGVVEGMRVVDAHGDEVGTVKEVRLSYPGAIEGGVGSDDPDLVDDFVDGLFGETDLSHHEQERLARLGFVRINARGLFARDRYAAADEIASVTGDEVRLTVASQQLVG